MVHRNVGRSRRPLAIWSAAVLVAGTAALLAASTSITNTSEFAVAYAYTARESGRTVTRYAIARSARISDVSWSAELPGTSTGNVIIIPNDGVTAPYVTPLTDGSRGGSRSTSTLSLSYSQAFRQIPLRIVYDVTLPEADVIDWIDESILVGNALFAGQRMGIYLERIAVESYTLPEDSALGCGYLDSLPDPTAAEMVVYVGPLTSEMLKIGTTCTGVRKLAVAYGAQFDVLAHEVAHNLFLVHPKDADPVTSGDQLPAGCVENNVMVPTASSRTDITEGQVVRAHSHQYSFLIQTGMATQPSPAWTSIPDANMYLNIWDPTVP